MQEVKEFLFLDEFKDFSDVFNTTEDGAGGLPEHASNEYTIKVEGEPPFSPLYNLSTKELRVLRAYLDDALAKS